jgi:hypothetical protein
MQDFKKMIGFLKKPFSFLKNCLVFLFFWKNCLVFWKNHQFLKKSNGYCFILLNLKIEFSIKK